MTQLTIPRCNFIKKNRAQCKRPARIGNFCRQHFRKNQENNEIIQNDETDYKYKLDKNDPSLDKKLNKLLSEFHSVVSQPQPGQKDQNGSTIENLNVSEIIDVLSELLEIHFKNIEIKLQRFKPDKQTLSSRYILLPENEAVIVVKTTKNSTKKQIQELSKYDFKSFKDDPLCKMLYYFIYDPEKRIENTKRFQGQLSGKEEKFVVRAIVSQT